MDTTILKYHRQGRSLNYNKEPLAPKGER